MIPILIIARSTAQAWAALQRLGITSIDKRVRVCTEAHHLIGWGKGCAGAVVDDNLDALPSAMKSVCADRDVRLIRFDSLPTALAGMGR